MLIPSIVLTAALLMILWERRAPGQKWPQVPGWISRAILLNTTQAVFVLFTGLLWNRWMIEHRLWLSDRLGHTAGALLGYLVITFVYYWWHRCRHEIPFLWRLLHQIHHSPQRLEIFATFYKHPLEILINCALTSVILYWLVGLEYVAATGAVLLTGIGELFYHWNHRTPHWIGYLFQRPESHLVHHEEGIHHYNYSDLPLWDMLFGTFSNPREWQGKCGFGAMNENRVWEMLRGVDVCGKVASVSISDKELRANKQQTQSPNVALLLRSDNTTPHRQIIISAGTQSGD